MLAASNAIRAPQQAWDTRALDTYVDDIMQAFGGTVANCGDPQLGAGMIFVVGMPRSGSTLVEQVLSAHPRVAAAGELLDAHAVIDGENRTRGLPLAEWAATASGDDWRRLGNEYLSRIADVRHGAAHVVDKQLDNWRYVGALHAMLPAARFVHASRDPVETCWSCFKHNFYRDQAAFSYRFDDLADYWADTVRLLRFWSERYPGLVLEHSLESFVAHPTRGVRSLLSHCGLSFDPACLRFQEAERPVFTASAGQVRQGLSRATARAARYGELLQPLRAALQRATKRAAGPVPSVHPSR